MKRVVVLAAAILVLVLSGCSKADPASGHTTEDKRLWWYEDYEDPGAV